MASVLVEGGAAVAKAFLEDGLVDRIVLFRGAGEVGPNGIAAPIDPDHIPPGFRKVREMRLGEDSYAEWAKDF
jgi:diaminohydroxyphosphoribosylaminopyrimidine deaminase/5-amino-6-(5-phosphoribosylamino)uracil reductase